jgi:hypothetical protein
MIHSQFRLVPGGALELIRRCTAVTCLGHCVCAAQGKRCSLNGNKCNDVTKGICSFFLFCLLFVCFCFCYCFLLCFIVIDFAFFILCFYFVSFCIFFLFFILGGGILYESITIVPYFSISLHFNVVFL